MSVLVGGATIDVVTRSRFNTNGDERPATRCVRSLTSTAQSEGKTPGISAERPLIKEEYEEVSPDIQHLVISEASSRKGCPQDFHNQRP